jgi:hypothetical protein
MKPATTVLHSKADDAVPIGDSKELVRNSGLRACTSDERASLSLFVAGLR